MNIKDRQVYLISKEEFFDLKEEFYNEDYKISTIDNMNGLMKAEMIGKIFLVTDKKEIETVFGESK